MWDSLVTKQRRKTSLLCGEGIRQATHTLQFLPRYCFLALVVFSRNVCRYQRDKYRYFLSKHLSCTTLCHLFLVSTSCRIDGTSEYRRCSCKMYFNMRVWLHLVPAESRSFFIYIPGLRPYSPSITHRCVCVCANGWRNSGISTNWLRRAFESRIWSLYFHYYNYSAAPTPTLPSCFITFTGTQSNSTF